MAPAFLTVVLCLCCPGGGLSAQEQDKEKDKAVRESEQLVYKANSELAADAFEDAEVNYREAISKNADNAAARYNLGNAYYRRENLGEAFSRYKQAGEIAGSKTEKHKAYHNLGNVFMKNKEYQKAVEAYKEALRNNPADEETRYNLALAKEMLKNDQNQGGGDDNKDQDKDQQDKDQGGDQNQDQQDQGKEGDNDNEENKDQQNKDQDDQGNEGDNEEQQPGEQDEKGDEESPQDGQGEEQQGEPQEGQGQPQEGRSELSPQQIKALLEAMGREEKRVQDKINAKKAKETKSGTSSEKDW
ncbi:hypothetical protein DN748_08060 [Sinomicrobium soli]|nr:hypothetical protein DN748_08060 [Sinomicrobium sp. N-1-3-6]